MSTSPEKSSSANTTIRPPQLIQSLVGGFNTVANNIALILLPVGLDLLLWFGPHLRVRTLFEPALERSLAFFREYSSQEMRPMLQTMEELWRLFLERYNLLTTLSTIPVGVPSQTAGMLPVETPLGAAPAYELSSMGQFFLGWLGLTLAGFLLGSLYFAVIARACGRTQGGTFECPDSAPAPDAAQPAGGRVPALRPGTLAWQTLQVIALVLMLLVIIMILMIPVMILTTLLVMINPMLAQFAMLLLSFSIVWLLVPLVFSPHGIFLCGQSVFNAVLNSSRVVRLSLPGTGLFLLVAVILHQGLGVLWNSPPETSWLALVSILGRAFISTGLLAASFYYYRAGLTYLQALRRAALLKVS